MRHKQKTRKLPDFDKMTWREEAKWWESHNIVDYLNEFELVRFKYEPEYPVAKKSQTKALNMTIDAQSLSKLRAIAKSRGIGHSMLARIWVLEKLRSLEISMSEHKRR